MWNKSKSDDDWTAMKKCRAVYCKLLINSKSEFYSEKILEAKGDTKQLYNTINGLIDRSKTNPLPEGQSDKELADYFSEFFYNKIKKITDKLKDIPDYIPPKRSVEQLSEFGLVDEDILNKVLIKLGNKQCELDKFPVKFINKHKKELLPIFLEIINNSLQSGSFPENCKNALVKPLIKKLSLGTTEGNYRPVSNLKHVAKVIECCAVTQIVQHCDRYLPVNHLNS